MEAKLWKYFIFSPEDPLFFTSLLFWGFMAVALLVYSFVYKKSYLRNAYLLIISYYFYYLAGGWFFLMLVFSTLVDYFLGLRIHSSKTKLARKLFLATSIFINLSILAYFKYAYFFTDILSGIFGADLQVTNIFAGLLNRTVGTDLDIHTVILPIGVSFYTFQTISYTVDVFRKKVKPVKSIIDFGFYVSFFPQLVAGPIVRAASFIPQLYQKYNLTERQVWHAGFLILGGLMKKILVADYLAMGLIDKVFESPSSFTGLENLLSIYAYAIQIYFDFSGYTDIAIGVALLLGFKLPINFNSPYQAQSLRDFWRRWHISLSSWLRDYLYIPLGGNRKGKFRTGLHLMATMVLGGLWHGAHWRFVLWGLYHGLLLMLERLYSTLMPKHNSAWSRALSRILTFHLVIIGWLIFRAETPSLAWEMISQIFGHFGGETTIQFLMSNGMISLLLLGSLIIISLPSRINELFRGWFLNRSYWIKIIIVLVILFVLYQFQISEFKPFIYFRF